MKTHRSRELVERFNDCINSLDLDGLAQLMSTDHRFIDMAGSTVEGKAACKKAWEGFFSAFPDYQNHFEHYHIQEDQVVVIGYSTCSDKRLEGRGIWSARMTGDQLSEWRVHMDTPEVRSQLGIDG